MKMVAWPEQYVVLERIYIQMGAMFSTAKATDPAGDHYSPVPDLY
jgi:hypothetical protein